MFRVTFSLENHKRGCFAKLRERTKREEEKRVQLIGDAAWQKQLAPRDQVSASRMLFHK